MSFINKHKATYAFLLFAGNTCQMNAHQEVITFVANVLPIASVVSFAVDKYCTSPLVFNFNIDDNDERNNDYNKNNKDRIKKPFYNKCIFEMQQRSKVLCESKIQTLLNITILLGTCYTLYEMRKSFFQHDAHPISLMYQGGCCLSLIWQIHNWSNAITYAKNYNRDLQKSNSDLIATKLNQINETLFYNMNTNNGSNNMQTALNNLNNDS